MSSSPTAHRTVLITGTSSGIGLHAAVAAASAGWDVVATLRDTARAGALRDATGAAGVELDIRALDVTDLAAVDRVVGEVAAEHGSLDAVVNNAGAGRLGTVELMSLDDARGVMEVNFFAAVAVARAAMSHLRASRGRLLTVTSVGGTVGQPFNEMYCASKFALEGFFQGLHPVAASLGVAVAVIEPAAVASEFAANATTGVDELLAEAGVYEPALRSYLDRTQAAFAAAQPVDEVGRFVAEALDRDPLPFRLQTSEGAARFAGLSLADLDGATVAGVTSGWIG